jgi:DNA-binding response OmpR family regulator
VPADPGELEAEAPAKISGHGERIAFVDDEPAITLIAQRGLAMHGYQPTTFDLAHGLLDHLESGGEPFEVIITDQMMPGMTGLEMIRELRSVGNHTPVIILSGNARYVSENDLAGLGNVQFMPKPFDIGSLLERISVVLALGR